MYETDRTSAMMTLDTTIEELELLNYKKGFSACVDMIDEIGVQHYNNGELEKAALLEELVNYLMKGK